jgi:predicted transcriptional regulator
MLQPKNDPFFEQLKADVEEGIRDVAEGRVIPEHEVREYFRALGKQRKRQQRESKG